MCVPWSSRGLRRELADRRQGQEPQPVRVNMESFDWFHRSYDNPVRPRYQSLDPLLFGVGYWMFCRRKIFATMTDFPDRKSTRLNSSHVRISYAVFCLKQKNK